MYMRMRQFAAFMVTLATLCGLARLPTASAQEGSKRAGDADVQSAVLDAFRRRQEKVRSFRFQWKETTIEGAAPKDDGNQPRPKSAEEAAMDAQERAGRVALAVDKTFRLIVDGNRVRFEEDSTRLGRDGETMVPLRHQAAYDGEVGIDFTSKSSSSYPLGNIEAADLTRGLEYVGSAPLVLAYRGLDWARAQFLASQQPLIVRTGVLGKVDCRILRSVSTQAHRPAYEIWVDPARDYLVLRFVKYSGGKLSSRTDISYRDDAELGWVPSAWKRSHWNTKQRLEFTVHATVVDYAINPPIDALTFTIEFVPGTYVFDRRTKEEYIVREGGAKRVVLPSEWNAGATYEQLLNSESPAARRTNTLFVIVLSSLLVVTIVVLIVWRRFSKASRGSLTSN